MSKFKVESRAEAEALRAEWEAASGATNRALGALNRAHSALTHAEAMERAAWAAYVNAIGVEAIDPVKPSNRKRLEMMFGPQDEG